MEVMNIRELGDAIKNSENFEGIVSFNEPLAEKTTMKVGGPALIFVEPEDVLSLVSALVVLKQVKAPVFVLGGGSNIVVKDEGIRKVVISTAKLRGFSMVPGKPMPFELEDFEQAKECCPITVSVGAGTSVSELTEWVSKYGIIGLQKFAGLPGTVGGACFMNARCYGEDFGNLVMQVKYIDMDDVHYVNKFTLDSVVKTYTHYTGQSDWDYKKSPFQGKRWIIIEASLALKCIDMYITEGCFANPAVQDYIRGGNSSYIKDREEKGHFKAPSAGSVFKNNREFGKPSGKIIDEVGLKGTKMGGAQVAPWHGNFIINNGNATAADVKNLVAFVQEKVKENTGFSLESEIIFV